MRARGGGVLSASALVAVGTSLLLAAFVGLGINELAGAQSGGPTTGIRTEAAAVVVPGGDAHQRASTAHARHSPTPPAVVTRMAPPVVPAMSTATHPRVISSTAAPRSARHVLPATASSPKPSPAPPRAHGKGKAKGARNGNGHRKPSKH